MLPNGIIIKGIGGFYYVKIGDEIYECKAKGIFRNKSITPLPGDMVTIAVIDENKKIGNIEKILPRQSELIRPQVANVNQVAVVFSVKSPLADLMLIDKLLLTINKKNLDCILCINKIDIVNTEEIHQIKETFKGTDYNIVLLSKDDDNGFKILNSMLSNKVTVFAGQSGVGKSTILNKLMASVVMETGTLSQKIQRGKHTTRHAELISLNGGGYLVDTPGFSTFQLSDIKYDELYLYYPEFREYENLCRFRGCSHINEPDCRVKEALKNGYISEGRYKRYIEIYNTLKAIDPYKGKKGN